MKKEIILDLSKYKIILERIIYSDLNIEEYILENFSTNKIEISELIKKIQIKILNDLNIKYDHHNDIFNIIDEPTFITKIVNLLDIIEYLIRSKVDIKFDIARFKNYKDKNNLIIAIELEYE